MSRRQRHGGGGAGWLVAATLLAGSGIAAGQAEPPAAAETADAEPLAAATRGMTGEITIIDTGAGLAPRADLSLEAPLVARIAQSRPVETADAEPAVQYVIQFIGTVEGVFDVRTALQRPDGSFPADLAPLPVMIERNLDEAAGTDVFVDARPPSAISGRYRATLIALFTAWALVPAVVLGTRVIRRMQVTEPEPPPPPPSLAERLEPLVIAAAERSMTVEERGRLELLLIAHLGERTERADGDAAGSRAAMIAALRRAPDTGALLGAVESWLHQPGPVEPRRRAVAGLLAPFRRGAVPAAASPEPQPEAATR